MSHCKLLLPIVGFGETRLSTNQFVMKKWQDLILREGSGRTFLMAGSLNNCEPPDDVDDVPSTPQEESLKLSMDKSLLGGHAKGGALLLASFFVLIFVFHIWSLLGIFFLSFFFSFIEIKKNKVIIQ